ncbi:hypothetical protein RvY_16939 [Ramazzottius varieornatus]|uniref:RIIa domain-containing protein n=1 Tax=Ramazzottius varieornatus TaxID=947166 RepID=A0A1D1W0W1_RAMVA|nr:hypothetical protein RvY_16939 [Ramazzottius varieornatus]
MDLRDHPSGDAQADDQDQKLYKGDDGLCPCAPSPTSQAISKALFKVPDGFQALLKHMTRELLNAKPKDPYVYISEFLRVKLSDKKKGLLEQEFFNDDTLNIDIKPPMHYLNQTSLANVACPSTTAFDTIAAEAATTLQATYRGMQGRDEFNEKRRDSTRNTGNELEFRNRVLHQGEICAQITPSVLDHCGYDPNTMKKVGSKNSPNQTKPR